MGHSSFKASLGFTSKMKLFVASALAHGMGIMGTDGLLTTTATMERDLQTLSQQQLPRLMPSRGGTDLTGTMATLLMAMATTGRGLLTLSQQQLLRLMRSPGGTDLTGTMATLLMATATTERGQRMLSQ